ncbi:unnamed protein product, partial [Lymnaea stagnalis]
MCVIFFYLSEICTFDGYKLVLVNNRDETWDRPTRAASFWDNGNCISGLDEMPDRSGGTWLGMNKDGKVGALLNILGQQDHSKEGRGFLVTDFITGDSDIKDYAQKVLKDKDKYNGFNLLLFDLGKQEDNLPVKPFFVSNALNYTSCVNLRTLPSNTFFGVSNSPLEYPFQKVIKGKDRFGQIVSKYPAVCMKEHLVKNLLVLMSDQTPLLPDPVLERAATLVGLSPERSSQQSAINVMSPESKYGSRTTTIILVDGKGNVDYIEQTVTHENLHVG